MLLVLSVSGCKWFEREAPPDNWFGVTTLDEFEQFDVAAHSESAKLHLDNVRSIIARSEQPTDSDIANLNRWTFALRLRPLGKDPVHWSARGGTQELVSVYGATGVDPGGCLVELLPAQDVEVDDGPSDADEPADPGWVPEEIPEEPVILQPPADGSRCGTISTIRSLLKLGWVTGGQATDGDMLKPDFVTAFDAYLGTDAYGGFGLVPDKEREAHRDHVPAGKRLETTDYEFNELVPLAENDENLKSWRAVKAKLDAGADCIVDYIVPLDMPYGSKRNGNHAEMLTKVDIGNATVTITMQDALKQGPGGGNGINKRGKDTRKTYHHKHKDANNVGESPLNIRCYRAVDAQ